MSTTSAWSRSASGAARESVDAEAVQAELKRVLASAGFRYSERLSRFLRFVVEKQLSGDSSQIKESVLALEVFDRETTYDSRVDSVVRVEARRLREKLDRYYSDEGRNDPVIIAIPKGSYAPLFALHNASAAEPPVPEISVPSSSRLPLKVGAGALLFSLILAAALRWIPGHQAAVNPPLRRMTSDPGLTCEPTLSRDGRLLAYASDKSGTGNLNIWLRQVGGGTPLRLTDNSADDIDPTFSPAGDIIAYRAEGASDGVYLVPALGGKRTLLAPGGYRPRFSPDGTHIAYWTGERTFRSAKIFIVPTSGGNPVPFVPDFPYAAFPIWSPDGRYILFVGSRGEVREESNNDDWDWWVAPVAGGPAVRLYAQQIFERQGLQPPQTDRSHHRIVPDCWIDTRRLLCSARHGDQTNIWRLQLSANSWRVKGQAEQLTFGVGRADHPSVAGNGDIAFSVLTHQSGVWALPIDADTARVRGSPVQLTSSDGNYLRPTVGMHGDRLTYLSDRTGNDDVWVKNLRTGVERALTATAQNEISPLVSPDGTQVAFGYASPLRESISLIAFTGGPIRQLCSDCGEPRAWFPNGQQLLYQKLSQGESRIGALDLSGRTTILASSSKSSLFSPSVSRDGKWIALLVRTPPNDDRIAVVPLHNGSAAPVADWVFVTQFGYWVNKPRWSPNGNLIYYISDRDGFDCIWASHLDARTKRPVGAPVAVMHFHSDRGSLDSAYGLDAYGLELSVADDKLVFDMGADSGNIWLAPGLRP